MKTLLHVELVKLRHQRLVLTTFALCLISALILPQLTWLFGESSASERGFHVLGRALELSMLLACYLLLLQASMSMVVERHDRTLRGSLVAPVRRRDIVLARWFALQLTIVLLVVTIVAAAAASTAFHFTFGDVYEEAIEPLAEATELRTHVALGVLHLVLPLVALVSVGFFISVFTRSPATEAGLSLGALILLDISKSMVPGSSPLRLYFFNSYLPTLFDRSSYLHGATAYAQGIADLLWLPDAPEHVCGVVVPLVTGGVCLLAALWLFTRRDWTE